MNPATLNIDSIGIVTNHSISSLLRVLNTELPYPHHGLLSIYDILIISTPEVVTEKEQLKINNLVEVAKEHKTEIWFANNGSEYNFALMNEINVYDVDMRHYRGKQYVVFNLNDYEIPQYEMKELKFTYNDDVCALYLISGKKNFLYAKNKSDTYNYLVKKNKINCSDISNSDIDNFELKPLECKLISVYLGDL